MPKPLPIDPAARQAIASEAATAERIIMAAHMNVRAMESVGHHARDPIFQGPAARQHLADEFARLEALLWEPPPSMVLCAPYITIPEKPQPSPGEERLACDQIAEYLLALHRELVRVQREAVSPVEAPPVDPLAITLEILAGRRRAAEIVGYLAPREGQCATLHQIASSKEVYGRKTITDSTLRNVRRYIEEVAKILKAEGAPLRLTIERNTVYIISTDNQTRCDEVIA